MTKFLLGSLFFLMACSQGAIQTSVHSFESYSAEYPVLPVKKRRPANAVVLNPQQVLVAKQQAKDADIVSAWLNKVAATHDEGRGEFAIPTSGEEAAIAAVAGRLFADEGKVESDQTSRLKAYGPNVKDMRKRVLNLQKNLEIYKKTPTPDMKEKFNEITYKNFDLRSRPTGFSELMASLKDVDL